MKGGGRTSGRGEPCLHINIREETGGGDLENAKGKHSNLLKIVIRMGASQTGEKKVNTKMITRAKSLRPSKAGKMKKASGGEGAEFLYREKKR